jgi:hypothetical protein
MPIRSRDEVLAYAEGVYKLVRARKHLKNRGAETACIRLLESVIKKTEREFFNSNNSASQAGVLAKVSKGQSKFVASTRVPSRQTNHHKSRRVDK